MDEIFIDIDKNFVLTLLLRNDATASAVERATTQRK